MVDIEDSHFPTGQIVEAGTDEFRKYYRILSYWMINEGVESRYFYVFEDEIDFITPTIL